MNIEARQGVPEQIETGALIAGCFEKTPGIEEWLKPLDKQLSGLLRQLRNDGEIKGKKGEVTIVHTCSRIKPRRLVVVGLGKKGELDVDRIRCGVSDACRILQNKGVDRAAVFLPSDITDNIDDNNRGQSIAEGAVLGSWSFDKYVSEKNGSVGLQSLQVIAASSKEVDQLNKGIKRGVIMAEAANMAREMINEPANNMTPADMAEAATRIADKHNLSIDIFEKDKMEEMGMKAALAVAAGSSNSPRFIVLKYTGRKSDELDLALVGKAVTFDSGGISIKPSEKMEMMKMDMAGGASVIAAMDAIAALKPEINVTAFVCAVENLPGGKAQRPGDIVRAMSGKTIEVITTDAEGRMTLADAITYARSHKARRIVDVATLTGACVIALGEVTTGAFTNNKDLVQMVIGAGEEAGEPTWQLPTFSEYKEQNKSDIADIKNVGGREAGAITAALFVGEFAGDTPWVHLDIAGTAMASKDRKYWKKGGTGIPVRTLINLACKLTD